MTTTTLSQFTLYQTDKTLMMSAFGHDCLYHDPGDGMLSFEGLIPFCLRSEIAKQSDDQDNTCYGKQLSFQQLKSYNIRIKDLFWWNAPIDIIELYAKYLLSDNLVDDKDQYYCNCSDLWRFGKFCQYDIVEDYIYTKDTERKLGYLLSEDTIFPLDKGIDDYFTCYTGIRCQTNLFCLD